LIIGIWLIQQYDFSYKKNSWIIITGFVLAILIAGYVVDMTGLNDAMMHYGPMKGMMRNHIQNW